MKTGLKISDLPYEEKNDDPNKKFDVASNNSDSNCFRERTGYSFKLVKEKYPTICKRCVYNKSKQLN